MGFREQLLRVGSPCLRTRRIELRPSSGLYRKCFYLLYYLAGPDFIIFMTEWANRSTFSDQLCVLTVENGAVIKMEVQGSFRYKDHVSLGIARSIITGPYSSVS